MRIDKLVVEHNKKKYEVAVVVRAEAAAQETLKDILEKETEKVYVDFSRMGAFITANAKRLNEKHDEEERSKGILERLRHRN